MKEVLKKQAEIWRNDKVKGKAYEGHIRKEGKKKIRDKQKMS